MNRKMAKRLLQRGMGAGKWRIFARRVKGVCMLIVSKAPRWPWERVTLIVVGEAKRWEDALKQARSGHTRVIE